MKVDEELLATEAMCAYVFTVLEHTDNWPSSVTRAGWTFLFDWMEANPERAAEIRRQVAEGADDLVASLREGE